MLSSSVIVDFFCSIGFVVGLIALLVLILYAVNVRLLSLIWEYKAECCLCAVVVWLLCGYLSARGFLSPFLSQESGLTRKEFEELIQQRQYHTSLGIGGAIAAYGVYLAFRRTRANEEQVNNDLSRVISERYTRAVELLAHESLAVRQGGIYALERIMKDSPDEYHNTIIEVLCAFVREQSREKNNTRESIKIPGRLPEETALDICSALRVLARRNVTIKKEVIMDMRGAKVSCFDFGEGNFENAIFSHAELSWNTLNGINLSNASLVGAKLDRSKFFRANLTGAELCLTDFSIAEGLTKEQLAMAKTLHMVTLDPELDQALRDYLGEEKYRKLVLEPPSEEN